MEIDPSARADCETVCMKSKWEGGKKQKWIFISSSHVEQPVLENDLIKQD